MEPVSQRGSRGSHANGYVDGGGPARRTYHGNRQWVADSVAGHTGTDSERWERGGHKSSGRGRGRGSRGKSTISFHQNIAFDGGATGSKGGRSNSDEEPDMDSNLLETAEEREAFWNELVKGRETERKKAITEGKMDDPLKPKRLEDAITMVGTCMDMCPRFERYRRERENNLFEWETIPGTKRVDHERAVKAYERAAGDKTLPSDLRPPDVLKRTLDYLFRELLPHSGFSETFNFIRDRSRAVRNDFTMQHETGQVAIECHDRCARFHILALHIERDRPGFSIAMEEQQLMNTLQSLKEFYQDQRDHYQSPTELEMRVYHRLVHIRDQRERHDDISQSLLNHPVFELTTKFRARVQTKSAPITKTSPLVVDLEAMHVFSELADVLRLEGNFVMTYLIACILERHFGKDAIEGIESIRGNISLSDIIDGVSAPEQDAVTDVSVVDESEEQAIAFSPQQSQSTFFQSGATNPPSEASVVPAQSAFSNLRTTPNAFSTASFGTQNTFAGFTTPAVSVFKQMEDNSVPVATEASHAPADFPTPAPAPSTPPFFSTSIGIQSTIFTSEGSNSDTITPDIPLVTSAPPTNLTPLQAVGDQTSPAQPPPLSRRQPISLPPTPTATIFIPPSFPSTRKSIFGSLKNIQTSPLLPTATEILSPLVLHSPASRSLPSMPYLPRRESIQQSPLKAVISATDVEMEAEPSIEKAHAPLPAVPPPVEKPSLDIMKATALHFARRGWLVKQAFSQWRQKLKNQLDWIEACQRSACYKEKVQTERLSRSVGGSPRSSSRVHQKTPSETCAPLKKRLRERLSGEYRPPSNDEELARRFEKNHDDHARRWARGSFLGVLKNFLESTRRPLPDNWSAWLSLNLESDGTAIWLEQKFNVPDSGRWRSENVFNIPISNDHVEPGHSYPGIVIFERTPLTGVMDILGRKYRVLEDCARLREIIEAFPLDRHYVPSLLCVAWSERDPDSSKDFDDMVESMVEGGILTSSNEFMISTAALDMESKLGQLLRAVPFDLEGRLVKRVSLNDLFKMWEHQWEETTMRWFGNCIVYGEFSWDLYGKLLEGYTCLLIQIIDSVTSLLQDDAISSGLPCLKFTRSMDSSTTFDAVLDWLQTLPETKFTASLMGDIRAHQSLGRDFPTMTFLSQLYALTRSVATHTTDVHPEVTHFVSRSRLDDTLKEIERSKVSLEEEMKACQSPKLKPSKRLASLAETSSSRVSTPKSKKQRLSNGSPTDEETISHSSSSPPLSIATSASSEPVHPMIVTPAMLRSLTKDIRAKYGTAQVNTLSVSATR